MFKDWLRDNARYIDERQQVLLPLYGSQKELPTGLRRSPLERDERQRMAVGTDGLYA